jgi:hypothetical protein
MAFVAITLAGCPTGFGGLDWDEDVDLANVADDVNAIPALVEMNEISVLRIERQARVPVAAACVAIPSSATSHSLVRLGSFFIQHQNIRERAPPISKNQI